MRKDKRLMNYRGYDDKVRRDRFERGYSKKDLRDKYQLDRRTLRKILKGKR